MVRVLTGLAAWAGGTALAVSLAWFGANVVVRNAGMTPGMPVVSAVTPPPPVGAKGDTTAQVFGCGGTLSDNPPLCAALNRHVAQLSVAGQSNPANFYKAGPANYYAAFWHRNAINGKQYGFPYDDDANQSSDISVTSPQYMIVAVGW